MPNQSLPSQSIIDRHLQQHAAAANTDRCGKHFQSMQIAYEKKITNDSDSCERKTCSLLKRGSVASMHE